MEHLPAFSDCTDRNRNQNPIKPRENIGCGSGATPRSKKLKHVGYLRQVEGEDGLMRLVGPCQIAIEAGARIVIVPITRPTSTDVDLEIFASSGPASDTPPPSIWDAGPIRLGRLDGSST